jgi:hypothetical protein
VQHSMKKEWDALVWSVLPPLFWVPRKNLLLFFFLQVHSKTQALIVPFVTPVSHGVTNRLTVSSLALL